MFNVVITNEFGEHITGEIHSIVVNHAYSDATMKVLGVEIESITFYPDGNYDPDAPNVTVVYPND